MTHPSPACHFRMTPGTVCSLVCGHDMAQVTDGGVIDSMFPFLRLPSARYLYFYLIGPHTPSTRATTYFARRSRIPSEWVTIDDTSPGSVSLCPAAATKSKSQGTLSLPNASESR